MMKLQMKLKSIKTIMGDLGKKGVCLCFIGIQIQPFLRFLPYLSLFPFCKVIPGINMLCAFLLVGDFLVTLWSLLEINLSCSFLSKGSQPWLLFSESLILGLLRAANSNKNLMCAGFLGTCWGYRGRQPRDISVSWEQSQDVMGDTRYAMRSQEVVEGVYCRTGNCTEFYRERYHIEKWNI